MIFALLGELSCSPWKFDTLWDVWQEPGHPIRLDTLEHVLVSNAPPDVIAFGAGVLDDISVFVQLVGPLDEARHPREAYRCAYIALRPVLARTVLSSPQSRSGGASDSQDFARLGFAHACSTDRDIEGAHAVLGEAAEGLQAAGRSELANQYRATAHALAGLRKEQSMPDLVAQRAFRGAFSVSDAALMREFILQWWPLFDADFRGRSSFWSSEGHEARSLAGLKEIIDSLEPVATVLERSLGLSAALAGMLVVREASHHQQPLWVKLCRPDWLAKCQAMLGQLGESRSQIVSASPRQFQELSGAST